MTQSRGVSCETPLDLFPPLLPYSKNKFHMKLFPIFSLFYIIIFV
jgi:hypothetical protein